MLDLRNNFINKKILIYGFGATGKSCFYYLKNKNKLLIFDDNKKIIPKKLKKFRLNILNSFFKEKFDYIILSPGINLKKCILRKFIKKNKKKIITDLDIFYFNNLKNNKITITGTNGKSTTAKLLYEVLKDHKKDVRLIGNIGKPVLLEKKIQKKTIFIIEASSYQIEYSKYFKTNHAMILNISPDHLERHGNISNYVNAKLKLIYMQDNKGFAYIDKNNKFIKDKIQKSKIKSKLINVNLNNTNYIKKKIYNPYFNNQGNLSNLSFILKFGKINKLNPQNIIKTVNLFCGLKYRQEIIFQKKGITIINDSKSTSFSSSINLLKSYKNIYWLIGGKHKKGDKFNLEKKYCKNIKAYIFGEEKFFFKKNLKKKIKFQTFDNIKKALKKIIFDLNESKLKNLNILFSPAAASFDKFKNFEDRGKYFNNLIRKKNYIKKINAK